MELQEAIANRRSIKKFKHDVEIDDKALYQAIEQAADAPNHGMREPWRMIHITKDRLGDMVKQSRLMHSQIVRINSKIIIKR